MHKQYIASENMSNVTKFGISLLQIRNILYLKTYISRIICRYLQVGLLINHFQALKMKSYVVKPHKFDNN